MKLKLSKILEKNANIVYTRHVQFPHARHDKDYLDTLQDGNFLL